MSVLGNAVAPYLLWIKLGLAAAVIAAIAGAVLYYGHTRYEAAEAEAAKIIAPKDRALRANADAFRAFAARFRTIDRINAENIAAAAAAQETGAASAAQAKQDYQRHRTRIAALEAALKAERATCVDGRKPICGIPLR